MSPQVMLYQEYTDIQGFFVFYFLQRLHKTISNFQTAKVFFRYCCFWTNVPMSTVIPITIAPYPNLNCYR